MPLWDSSPVADISAAIAAAVSNGAITPSEVAEIAKLIDAHVRAHRAAEVDDRVALVEQMTDAELMRIASGAYATETRLLTVTHR